MVRKIYVASSWRNSYQPSVVRILRIAGHEVYDFRNPEPDNYGFRWDDIDPNWKSWTFENYVKALQHPIAEEGYKLDFDAMRWADTCVLVLPSGRSAHLEFGWCIGAGKEGYIFSQENVEPELMAKMATGFCIGYEELLSSLGGKLR